MMIRGHTSNQAKLFKCQRSRLSSLGQIGRSRARETAAGLYHGQFGRKARSWRKILAIAEFDSGDNLDSFAMI